MTVTAVKPTVYESVEKLPCGTPVLVRCLESIEELKDMTDFLDGIKGGHNMSLHMGSESWVGRSWDSPKACTESLNECHDKTMEYFEKAVEAISGVQFPMPQGIKRRPRIREDGERLDLQRYRDGDIFRYWATNKVKLPGGHQTVVIVQNMDVAGSYGPEQIAWRGAAGAALCKILTEAGYNVEYWMVSHTKKAFEDGGNLELAVRVKGSHERPDWVRMANLTSCWLYRTVLFGQSASEKPKPDGEDFGGGAGNLGYPSYNWDEIKFLQDRIAGGRPVIVIDGKPFSEKLAVKCVTKAVEKFVASF